jgi:hypothetical protein
LYDDVVELDEPAAEVAGPAQPGRQGLQAVPSTLQPFGQGVVVVSHFPFCAQVAADVRTSATHEGPAPHGVSTGLLPSSTQAAVPVAQEILPFLQTPGLVVQVMPAIHATQLPPLHTWSAPQLVPFGAALPVSVHTRVPESQLHVPVWQGWLAGVHVPPAVHATHAPALHTRFVPQDVPLDLLVVSPHAMPVAHALIPFLHTLVGWQLAPSVQAAHVPSLHTMFVPQEVPFGRLPVRPQTITPVAQEFAPVLHGFVGWQLVPSVHGEHVPALHTMFAPQEVPFALLPFSVHVMEPVAHEVTPFLHGFVGWQPIPAVQPPHEPLLHTWFVPQAVPLALFPLSAHVIAPVAQEVVPFLHGFVGWQTVPAVHAEQVPLLQTRFVPQAVPLDLLPVSAHTDAPVTHEVVPVLHTFVGWQLAPAVHATHVPLLQTWLVPHTVPLTRLVAASAQVMVGEQDVNPAWQRLVGVHANPAVHETQPPALQTMLVPQLVPFATFPEAAHTGAPVLQVVMPVRHGWPETVQLAPAVQLPQVPVALQTRLVPHGVPAARFVPVSVHCGAPVEHARVPIWQALVGAQVAPVWQETHCPVWHTMLVPQEVPFGRSPISVQTAAPVAQLIAPVRHGLAVTVQVAPAVQATQVPSLQTMFSPHTVPFACGCWVSMQPGPFGPQVVAPTWHRLASVHGEPAMQVGASVPPSVDPPAPAMPPRPPVAAAPVVPPPPATPLTITPPPPPGPPLPPRPAAALVPAAPGLPPSGSSGP